MGYRFEIDGGSSFAMNASQMGLMRELMREVGALVDPDVPRAAPDGPPVHPDAPPIGSFQSSSDQRVTAAQCRAVAERLRDNPDLVHETASFFDDAPSGAALRKWVASWVRFNDLAADSGGYRVG